MSMQFIKRGAQALSAAAIFCSMPAFAGTITPTGGTFSSMTPSLVPASYGSFSANQQVTIYSGFPTPVLTNVTVAQLSGGYSTSSLDVSSLAWTVFDEIDTQPRSGSIVGTLGFDLDVASSLHFALAQAFGSNHNLYQSMRITLRDSSNQIVLGCIGRGDYDVIGGGCLLGAQPTQGDYTEMPLDGDVELPAGHYELSIVAFGNSFVGTNSPTDFDFSLTVNP
jgi:hypothetical protein